MKDPNITVRFKPDLDGAPGQNITLEAKGEKLGYSLDDPKMPGFAKVFRGEYTLLIPFENILCIEMTL